MKRVGENILSLFLVAIIASCNGGTDSSEIDSFVGEVLPTTSTPDEDLDDDSGQVGNSAISFTPAIYSYGDVAILSTNTSDFVLTNTSDVDVFIDDFAGENSTFSITNSDCPSTNTAFEPGETCTIEITFAPSSGGEHSNILNVNYGVNESTINLLASLIVTGSSGANPPTNYELIDVTATTATISWSDNSQNEIGFEVSRCDGSTCLSNFVETENATVGSNTTSYEFTGLTEGSLYMFRVRALSSTSQSTWLNGDLMIAFGGISSIDDNGTGSADLTSIDCRSSSEGTYMTLSWASVTDALLYKIYDRTGGALTLLETVTSPTTSVTLTGIPVNSSRKYYISALTIGGLVSQNTALTSVTTGSFIPCLVLGRNDFTEVAIPGGLNQPYDIKIYDGKMFVVDRVNHRVLIWNSVPTTAATDPDIVLGQSNLYQRIENNTPGATGTVSSRSLRFPEGVWAGDVGGTDTLVVADTSNNRVLVWVGIPSTNHQAATLVVGQGTMTSAIADGGDVQKGTHGPRGVWSDGTKLAIADYSNHRVLIFNTFPSANFPVPDVFLGQANNSATGSSCNADRFNAPRGVWFDSDRLLVSETGCDRVRIWEGVPTTGNPAPDTSLTHTTVGGSGNGTGASDVNNPNYMKVVGGKIYLADDANNRVKIYNSIPASGVHNTSSDNVMGWSNTANTGGVTQERLDNPRSVEIFGTRAYVVDSLNNRIMVYNTIPTTNQVSASWQIGQSNFTREEVNNNEALSSTVLSTVFDMDYDGTQFFVADSYNNRVLVYNSMPTSFRQAPDYVIGQGSFVTENSGRTVNELNHPRGLCSTPGYIWVADYSNNRVMRFDTPITANNANASAVLGQTTFTAGTTGTGKDRVGNPTDCFYDGTNFFVTDIREDRVLIWNSVPAMTVASDNPPADVQIGTLSTATSQNAMRRPESVYSNGTSLFVVDYDSHRIMAWTNIPTVDDQNADFRLGGQASWTSRTASTSVSDLYYPSRITGNGTTLYLTDRLNARVLVYDNPTSTNDVPVEVYGQANFNTGYNTSGDGIEFSDGVWGIYYNNNRIFVGDQWNSRVVAFPVTP